MAGAPAAEYEARVRAQIEQFRAPAALSKLPPIYRYWTQKHIVPRIKAVFGTGSHLSNYFEAITAAIDRKASAGGAVIYSMGAGDCALEIDLAARLKQAGRINFRFVCLELSPLRLARARAAAVERGVAPLMAFVEGDLNTWTATEPVDVFIAHHTLHHVQALEHLYAAMAAALDDDGTFLTADMIGRNGHQRWPEAQRWVDHLWAIMPARYKFNFQLRSFHDTFLNWDCSVTGFEGIRAQEVLPLLLQSFDYDAFVAYGGIIDPFIERGYGHNLDPDSPYDTAFIDFVEDLNQTLLESGRLKPTMMLGRFCKRGGRRAHSAPLTPAFCVRDPGAAKPF